MSARKRSQENSDEDLPENSTENDDEEEQAEESDRSSSSSSEDELADEFVLVRLSDIRKEVQCPICLGIIKKTRTVMECLHRFCRECIDKSMRLGNNECPACRTHCASRRSLRDDPNYDALIAALYPDIDLYEEEEMAFHEEEKARNKQIQASIAQTFRRQSEALSKKRKRSQGTYRRRRNYRSDDDDDGNANFGVKDSSSADERCTEAKLKRPKRWRGQPSPAAATGDGACDENDSEVNREPGVATMALVGTSERLAWGKGGIRSHTRHGSGSGSNGKHVRNSRLAKLVDHLRNLDQNTNELDIHVILVSLGGQRAPPLQQPYFCCTQGTSVGQLLEFVAHKTMADVSLKPDDIELLGLKDLHSKLISLTPAELISGSSVLDACKNAFQVLDSKETLAELYASCSSSRGHLVLGYRQKSPA